jgi:chemotaxis protein CheZ
MPAQRKVFRIEHMLPQAVPVAVAMSAMTEPMGSHEQKEILAELKALRALMAQRADTDAIAPADLARLRVESDGLRRTLDRARTELASLHAAGRGDGERAARELGAVAEGAEHATQQILGAAKAIEDAAGTLAASVKRKQAQTLAQEIQEHRVRRMQSAAPAFVIP